MDHPYQFPYFTLDKKDVYTHTQFLLPVQFVSVSKNLCHSICRMHWRGDNFWWNLRCLVQSNSCLTQVPSWYCKISKHLIETNDYNNSTLSLQAHSHNHFNY